MVATDSIPADPTCDRFPDEYLVLLKGHGRFDCLLRKDDLLDDGVAAVFGLTGDTVELLALCFHRRRFTHSEVAVWLAERGLGPPPSSTRSAIGGQVGTRE